MSGNGISDAFLIFETEVSPKYRHKGRRTISNFRARFHGLWVKSNQALGKIVTREGQIISAKIIDQEIKANFLQACQENKEMFFNLLSFFFNSAR